MAYKHISEQNELTHSILGDSTGIQVSELLVNRGCKSKVYDVLAIMAGGDIKTAICCCVFFVICIFNDGICVQTRTTRDPLFTAGTEIKGRKKCQTRDPTIRQRKAEVFSPLTEKEMKSIRMFMVQQGLVSNATGENVTFDSNYIIAMDTSAPKKDAVIDYLDKNGTFPGRFATVTVVRGGMAIPDCMEYLVGPLGRRKKLKAVKMYQDGEIVYETRPIDIWERIKYADILKSIENVLRPLVKESFDGADFLPGDVDWFPINGPPGALEKERNTKVIAFLNPMSTDVHFLDMLPLSAVIHCTGNDSSSWFVSDIYYLNQGPFKSAQELMDAYNKETIRKVRLPKNYKDTIHKRIFVGRDETKPLRAYASVPPPRTYEPEGPRYNIQGHHVTWMGWSFDATARMMRGPAIFDVKYKDTRIAYEISLNDIALIYGSDSFARSSMFYTDSTYGIGYYDGIIKGIDCPEHASLLETSFYDAYSGTAVTYKSICVFEADGESAAWRHKAFPYYAGLRDTHLIVRLSARLGNYDYIIDYQFHLDGSIYTTIKATGFIQTAFWDVENPNRENKGDKSRINRDAFGFRVTDFGHGLIHDHMFGFKVDLDIIDTNNSFEVVHIKSGEVIDALKTQKPSVTDKPEYFTFNQTRYLEYEIVEKERGYQLNLQKPKLWTIVNENYRNHWGSNRGYQISPLATNVQTMVDSYPAMAALSFTKYTCAVTKRKDSEPFLTSLFDGYRLYNTKGDLDKKLNNESIRNEDLVNWVTVGFLHIPTSEDVPMTVARKTGFIIKPFNFFDRTDLFDMPQFYKTVDGNKTETPPSFEPCLEN